MTDENNDIRLAKLGNNLRKLRFLHSELSQQDLANAVGVTRLTIHSILQYRLH
jgi:DNA-binding XRE family transcriptional regulator